MTFLEKSNGAIHESGLRHFGSAVLTALRTGAVATGKGISKFHTNMQIARMEGVLEAMSDGDLKQIDLKRSEISQHARKLVLTEYDGL